MAESGRKNIPNDLLGAPVPSKRTPDSAPNDAAFQRAARLAARFLNAPLALVWQAGDGDSRVLGAVGVPDPCPAPLLSLVEKVCQGAHAQALIASGSLAQAGARELGIKAVACMPLIQADGRLDAYLCVLDHEARDWGEEELQAIRDLAAGLVAEIELQRLRRATSLASRRSPASEQETRAGELRFSAVFQAHPLPMTIHDYPDGRYLDVNEAWLTQTGFSREEAIGKTSSELNTYADPLIRARMFELLRDHGSVRELESDMRMKNGEIRRFLLTSEKVIIDGRVRLLSAIQDITELKRIESQLRTSEEQMRLIAHALPVYILHCDTGFRYKFVNTAYAARLGVAPDALLGRSIRDVLGEQAWRAVEEKLPRVLRGELVQFEVPIPYPGIGVRFMRSVNVPERDKDGTVCGFIGVLIDISEQKQLEETRAQLLRQSLVQAEQLRAADRRKDEFLAMLAHELRNPLAPINTAAQLLPRLVRDDPQAFRVVDIVQRQVKHMTRLVEDLLDISRITLGKITLRKEEVAIAQVVHAGVELARPLINQRGHDCIITVPAEHLVVAGDPARLAQVISNLLNNAAKYTEEHGRIALTVERHGHHVVVRVSDNGVGITAELLPHVFELFIQAERSLDRSQGGLGIGLALVKSLVEMHGGSVEAHSHGLGQGSEFTVRLPLLVQSALQHAELASALQAVRPRRILVVDDNTDAADSLAMLLRSEGHHVSVAYDAATALTVARQQRPDILLLDIGLPDTDGYALAGTMRALQELREAKLIAVTGYGLAEDRERARAAGFDHHLVKPIDIDALRSIFVQH